MPVGINLAQLSLDLLLDEGERLKPYTDSVGKLTIGVGRNLTDEGISRPESRYLLQNDILSHCADLDLHLPWWRGHPEPVQRVLANLCFNLGIGMLLAFHTFLALVQAGRYAEAGVRLLALPYAQQVGTRAQRLAALLTAA